MSQNHSHAADEVLVHHLLRESRFASGEIYTEILVKSENFSSALLCIPTGREIDEHISTGQICLQVISGEGVCVVGLKNIKVSAGSYVYIPPQTPHAIEAKEDLTVLLCLSHLLTSSMYRSRESSAYSPRQ